MRTAEFLPQLISTCREAIDGLIRDFETEPTRSGFSEIGSVAEVAILGEAIPESATLVQLFSDTAARWLRSGVVEEFCVARADLSCQAALLAYMAQRGATFQTADMLLLKRLCDGRMIGRSEIPALNQRLLTAYFNRCGIDTDFGDAAGRDLSVIVDKRVLRPRSDEYDISASLICAQLLYLDPNSIAKRPWLYPQVLLAQAVRSLNLNWTPVLAFLCGRWFSLDDRLRAAAVDTMMRNLPAKGTLLPAPKGTGIDDEYILRACRGLRIRSTIALAYSLSTLGDSYATN